MSDYYRVRTEPVIHIVGADHDRHPLYMFENGELDKAQRQALLMNSCYVDGVNDALRMIGRLNYQKLISK